VKRVFVMFFATLSIQASMAQVASPQPVIVDAAAVADGIARNALVWDVRPAEAFAKGHIPGAVSIGDAAAVLRDANTEDFVATAQIEKLLGAAGIDPAREVIVYGQRGGWQAYFGLYTLQYFGSRGASVFHGGIEDWAAAGRSLAQGPASTTPIALKLSRDASARVSVSTRDVLARLNRTDVQILDVRTAKEFNGQDIRAIRGGHIPGAVNIPYEQNWLDPEAAAKLARREVSNNAGMSLKPTESLKTLYAGLDPEKETIVYCQSGARASETAGVLQQLGFRNVKVYDPSWLGYGNTLDAPAENATFFNVGRMNAQLSTLQSRIEQLEKELAATKAGK
jgi:thiosulfate/3-mercaptopyruvate sulfurtransferase